MNINSICRGRVRNTALKLYNLFLENRAWLWENEIKKDACNDAVCRIVTVLKESQIHQC